MVGAVYPGAGWASPPAKGSTRFVDVTAAAGIQFRHQKPMLDHQLDNIMSWVASVGAAAAAGDFNNDGHVDLYLTNSRKGTRNALYRNNGDGTFTDVAREAGVDRLNGNQGTSMDCIWGDYDNDGWIDLYVVRWGNDMLFRNNHDGTFTDVSRKCFRQPDGTPGMPWANGNAAIFFDFNLDGRLDIYVGNYFRKVDLWHLKTTRIMHDDFEKARNGGRNFLFCQQTDGTFIEIAMSLGIDDPGWTLAVGSADINNDGLPDLYCADDFGPDQLFLNRGKGTFANVTKDTIGYDTKKGMNVDFGDFNNDGWLDVYVANITTAEYLQEGNMLWHNNGLSADGAFTLTDVSLETGTYDGGWGWGAKFLDYDNDGDLDILALNGFISAGEGNYWYDLATWSTEGENAGDARNWPAIGNRSFSGYEATRLFRNDGFYAFTERAAQVGLDSRRDGRGAVCFDYDNDGDIDLFIANQNQPPHLYRNENRSGNHWLTVALETDRSTGINRDAIGTRVTVVTSDGMKIRERDGGNGYCGQSEARLHFGMGTERIVSLLEVRWPDGGMQYLEKVPTNRIITVRQNPRQYAERVALAVSNPTPWTRVEVKPAPERTQTNAAQLTRLLADLEGQVRDRPGDITVASRYRAACAANGQHRRSIRFLEKLINNKPEFANLQIQLACAFVDKIPTCGGIAAVVSKGSLARKSLNWLDPVIDADPKSWAALYCRGMNHLHWPRALRHSDDAVADFQRCIAIQQSAGESGSRPYFIRTHVALGDAHVKAKQYDLAREAWRKARKLFPDSQELRRRLKINDNGDLLTFVEAQRNLQQAIDTDLSFLDR